MVILIWGPNDVVFDFPVDYDALLVFIEVDILKDVFQLFLYSFVHFLKILNPCLNEKI